VGRRTSRRESKRKRSRTSINSHWQQEKVTGRERAGGEITGGEEEGEGAEGGRVKGKGAVQYRE